MSAVQIVGLVAFVVVCAGAVGFAGLHLRPPRASKIRQDALYRPVDPAIAYQPRLKFELGTMLQCPAEGCHCIIAIANRDVFTGEPIASSAWTWVNGPHRTERGDATFECGKCRTLYMRYAGGRHELHTTRGWQG